MDSLKNFLESSENSPFMEAAMEKAVLLLPGKLRIIPKTAPARPESTARTG
jgi:hypothetical protein